MSLLTALEARLCDDWRRSWKWGSTIQHSVATAAVVDYVANNPGALNSLLYGLPPQWRFSAFMTLAGIWFVAGWAIRLWRGKPNG